eukprot:165780-Pelagomonas_calceolata.AAC.1
MAEPCVPRCSSQDADGYFRVLLGLINAGILEIQHSGRMVQPEGNQQEQQGFVARAAGLRGFVVEAAALCGFVAGAAGLCGFVPGAAGLCGKAPQQKALNLITHSHLRLNRKAAASTGRPHSLLKWLLSVTASQKHHLIPPPAQHTGYSAAS